MTFLVGHSSAEHAPPSYDALLLVSFGGPEGPDDVIPFLENVLRGRNVPRERLEEVAEHYFAFGGVSPINGQCRNLKAAVKRDFQDHGLELPVYWGNRNWHPLLSDTLGQMAADGIQHALAFVTSAYSSWSSCRQYLEDIQRARESAGDQPPDVVKLRPFSNHPGFIEPFREGLAAALNAIADERRRTTQMIFTAHSIPTAMARGCAYEDQLKEACRLVASVAPGVPWHLSYQSRSGPPSQPWLEPDVNHLIDQLASEGSITDLILCPIGFTSDHMEILFDLDTEAQSTCDSHGIQMARVSTPGDHPRFVQMIRELALEQIDGTSGLSLGSKGPGPTVCPADCCPSGRP